MVEDRPRDDLGKDPKPILTGMCLWSRVFALPIHNGTNLSQLDREVNAPFWALFLDAPLDLCHTGLGDHEWK